MRKDLVEILVKKLNQTELIWLIKELERNPDTLLEDLKTKTTESEQKEKDHLDELICFVFREIRDSLKEFGESNFYPSEIKEYVDYDKIVLKFSQFPFREYPVIMDKMFERNEEDYQFSSNYIGNLFIALTSDLAKVMNHKEKEKFIESVKKNKDNYLSQYEKEEIIKGLAQ